MTAHFANNLGQIEYGLTLYQNGDDTGVEFILSAEKTSISPRVDILAVDAQGDYVVIECKSSEAPHGAAGQVAAYVAILRERFVPAGSKVRAIILCQKASPLLWYAIREIPGVEIAVYSYEGSDRARRLSSTLGLWQLQLDL